MKTRVVYESVPGIGLDERLVVSRSGVFQFHAEVIAGLDSAGKPIWQVAESGKILDIHRRAILHLNRPDRAMVYCDVTTLNERLVNPEPWVWSAEVIGSFDAAGDPVWIPETNPAAALRIHQRAILHLTKIPQSDVVGATSISEERKKYVAKLPKLKREFLQQVARMIDRHARQPVSDPITGEKYSLRSRLNNLAASILSLIDGEQDDVSLSVLPALAKDDEQVDMGPFVLCARAKDGEESEDIAGKLHYLLRFFTEE